METERVLPFCEETIMRALVYVDGRLGAALVRIIAFGSGRLKVTTSQERAGDDEHELAPTGYCDEGGHAAAQCSVLP